MRRLALLAVLVGCVVAQSQGGSTAPPATSAPSASGDPSTPTAASTSADPAPPAANTTSSGASAAIDAPAERRGVTGHQSHALIGLSLDQAKQQLAALGYHGAIDVHENTRVVDTSCKYDTVCDIEPPDFQFNAPIQIIVNKAKMDIAAPPD